MQIFIIFTILDNKKISFYSQNLPNKTSNSPLCSKTYFQMYQVNFFFHSKSFFLLKFRSRLFFYVIRSLQFAIDFFSFETFFYCQFVTIFFCCCRRFNYLSSYLSRAPNKKTKKWKEFSFELFFFCLTISMTI